MNLHRYLFALLPLAYPASDVFGQAKFGVLTDDLQKNHTTRSIEKLEATQGLKVDDVRKVIVENFEKTYITGGSGLRLGGDQTAKDIMYEGQIFANLNWLQPQNDNAGLKQWVDIPIRIQVRQLRSESKPVRTPSYNPGLRWYGWHKDPGDKALTYYSVGLFHYSNGQDGPSTLADGSVNTQNGSFSTNYVELSGYRTSERFWIQWMSLELRQHFTGTWEPFQREQYEKGHVAARVRSERFLLFAQPSQIGLSGTYGYGRTFVIKNDVDPGRNVDATVRDNLSATLELNVKPTDWKDLAFYIRYDIGYDYYNINFQHRMNRIQLGLSSTNF
jgi:hypothetical protein